MPWVVTAWKPERLQAAERETRRLRRASVREAEDAAAYLLVLEDLGGQLREGVRGQRRGREPEPLPVPAKRPAQAPPEPAPGEIRASQSRPSRARMRDSPLSELFRATG